MASLARNMAAAIIDDNECAICMEAGGRTHALVPCGHQCICADCVAALFKGNKEEVRCPICREPTMQGILILE